MLRTQGRAEPVQRLGGDLPAPLGIAGRRGVRREVEYAGQRVGMSLATLAPQHRVGTFFVRPRRLDLVVLGEVGGEADRRGERMFVVRPEDGVVVVVTVPGQGHRVGEPAGLTQRDRDGPQRQQYLDVLVTEPVTVRRQRARLYPVRLVVPAQTVQVAGQVAD